MDYLEQLITQIELHYVEGIRDCFLNGIDPNAHYKGQPLIYELTSEYTRTPRFKECVKVFMEHGLHFPDNALLAVLSDDAERLKSSMKKTPEIVEKIYSLRCAYTPLFEVTLLHICAEFNHVACARLLVENGARLNAKAGIDENGFGGQTPIFHTVNQNSNNSKEMLEFFLANGVDLKITVPGIIWGKGYDWETLIPAVNPISYAMMGLLPQMHRKEEIISQVVSQLLEAAYGISYTPKNVPCKYLQQ